MNVNAVGLSRNDLAGGLDFLQEQVKRSRFKWLSANLVRKSTSNPILNESTILEIGPHKVGIIGLTKAEPAYEFKNKDDAILLTWQEVLPKLVADMSLKTDMLILLSNNTLEQNREIATTFKDIHIIIQSMPNKKNMKPDLINNTLLCQTGKQGKYLGWMLIDWQKSQRWGSDSLRVKISLKKQELDGLNGRIRRYEKRHSQEVLKKNTGYQKLLEKRDNLIFTISGLETELDSMNEASRTPSTFENKFIALDISFPDHPAVLKVVEETKLKVNEAGRAQAKSSKRKTREFAEESQAEIFTGWQICANCHKDQTDFWQKTDHYKAYRTLVDAGQQFNLSCLPCHVTADRDMLSDESNGSDILALDSGLQQVGCEACHGPGNRHAATQEARFIIRKPPENICRRCHTPARDNTFSYDNDINLIACPPDTK
jgi:hypothetical protein